MARFLRKQAISLWSRVRESNPPIWLGKLKIEATSFTISEPVESMEIAPMLYELASQEEKHILESQYQVSPFQIKTISLERAFIDKLFAAEAYTRKSNEAHRAFEAAKHIYDLSVMSPLSRIRKLYGNAEQMTHLLNIRMEEEAGRLDGIPGVKPQQFTFFDDVETNQAVRKVYVEWAKENGIVNGTSQTAFSPNQQITREQAACVLYRYAVWLGMDPEEIGCTDGFADRQAISPFARKAMA